MVELPDWGQAAPPLAYSTILYPLDGSGFGSIPLGQSVTIDVSNYESVFIQGANANVSAIIEAQFLPYAPTPGAYVPAAVEQYLTSYLPTQDYAWQMPCLGAQLKLSNPVAPATLSVGVIGLSAPCDRLKLAYYRAGSDHLVANPAAAAGVFTAGVGVVHGLPSQGYDGNVGYLLLNLQPQQALAYKYVDTAGTVQLQIVSYNGSAGGINTSGTVNLPPQIIQWGIYNFGSNAGSVDIYLSAST